MCSCIHENSFIFSRRFSRKKPTIVMDFRQCFFLKFIFDRPEVTKIVLPKVLQNFILLGFPRNIQYRTRPNGPPFQFFFRHCETFFGKKIPIRAPFSFLEFCDRMDVEKSQRVPLSVFSAL